MDECEYSSAGDVLFDWFLLLEEAYEVCHVPGTRCSLLFILFLCHVFPKSNGFYAYKNETKVFLWKHWIREKGSWARAPTLILLQYTTCYVSCFQGNGEKYFGRLKSKGSDKALKRRRRGKRELMGWVIKDNQHTGEKMRESRSPGGTETWDQSHSDAMGKAATFLMWLYHSLRQLT